MIGADAVRNVLALRTIEPFDRLMANELLMVSRHMDKRRFEAGALLLAAGSSGEMLFVTLGGEALAGEERAKPLFDAPSVLFSLPAHCDYRAGPSGLDALCLAKTHLFTIARECPDFIVGLASLGARHRT